MSNKNNKLVSRTKPTLKITIPNSPPRREPKPIQRRQTPRYINQYQRTNRLYNWEIIDYTKVYPKTSHYVVGVNNCGMDWKTTDIKRMEITKNKIRIITSNGTDYDLYHSDARNGVTSHVFLT